MSKKENSLYVQLGDIIQLTAPADISIHDKIFLVTFLNKSNIKLISTDGITEYIIRLNDDGTIGNESITSISILSRDDNVGYARQNNLLPGTWIDVFFSGDLPVTITGLITNIEEDMIEVKTYPDSDVIYLDFAYKGLPEDIPIEKIIIRTPPDEIIEEAIETPVSEVAQEMQSDVSSMSEDEGVEEEKEEDEIMSTPEKVNRITPIELKMQIKELLIDADKILIGEELGEVVQVIDVPEYEQRFNIDKQTNDLLDEMLSSIPNAQRTSNVINNIHKMIERFKQLRSEFSVFDKYGNADIPELKGANFKPLASSLLDLNKKLYWLLPVSKLKKKVYDIDNIEVDAETYKDVVPLTLAEDRIKEDEVMKLYKTNSIPDEENKYSYLLTQVNDLFTPYEDPDIQEFRITSKQVEDNITAIIDNLDDLKSSVVVKDGIARRKFVIQTYNLALTRLETIETQRKKSYLKRIKVTPNDNITIKSFISLPEPTIKYSHINLPNTNIIEKASLNMNNLYYWKLLNKKTAVNQLVVDNFDEELPFTDETYLNEIKEYVLNENIEDPDKYKKYLNTIIPKTRILFNLVKKYIDGKLSLYSIVKYLEPFLIYQKDLSFKQYETITEFVEIKIKDFKKNYVEKNKQFRLLKKDAFDETKSHLFSNEIKGDKYDDREIENYYSFNYENMSDLEILNEMIEFDYSRYFSTLMGELSNKLYSPEQTSKFYKEDNKLIEETDKALLDNKCKDFVLTKSYSSVEELQNDNDIEIYFDIKYDTTRYDIIDIYKRERETMDPISFKTFLIKEVMKKLRIIKERAEIETEAMILGKRPVREGQYAFLIQEDEISEFPSIDKTYRSIYHKRINNRWEISDDINPYTFAEDNRTFCNIQPGCFPMTRKNNCEDMNISNKLLKQRTVGDIYDEIEKDYIYSKREREEKIRILISTYRSIRNNLFDIKDKKMFKYDTQKVSIGETVEEYDVIESPHSKLRDLVLGQFDFVKKQEDIIRFTKQFTRDATETEEKYWRYCTKTNVKLLPIFFVRLAQTFKTGENYNEEYEKICAEQGTISDDGNAWVDKYSGYIIGRIDFDTEEGYDEQGYKVNTRDLIQEDIEQKILGQKDTDKQYENPLARQISNILYAMTSFMGIDLTNDRDFIVKNVLSAQQNEEIVPSKSAYEKNLQIALSKGKKLPSYESIYDSSLIYLTLSYMLIGILTSMPSIKSKKTFPNCIKSFTGYPVTGIEDKTSIAYIACVAHKIKSSVKPWSSINKTSQVNIATKIEAILERYVVPNKEVQLKINDKQQYLLNPAREDIIPVEHDIINWISFLPPLREIKMSSPLNISAEFKSSFIDNLKRGNSKQHVQIEVIKSKIIYFSIAIQKLIQNVVSKEMPILKSSAMEPYLENSCCNDEGIDTHRYFTKREPDIVSYNNIVIELNNVIEDVRKMTEASILYDVTNTKPIIPEMPTEFSEDTIYRAFVVYCRFNSLLPISETLRGICLGKPDSVSTYDSISEIVRKLKRDGRNYSKESLDMLMKLVNYENMIHLHTPVQYSSIHYLRLISENKETEFQTLLYDALDTYDVALLEDNKEVRNLKNFIGRENTMMLDKIKVFIRSHSKLNRTEYNNFINTINNISEFNLIETDTFNNPENATTYTYTNFIKNILRNIISVYPDIILNKVDYEDVNIPRHWKISHRHTTDVQTFINKYYSPLKSFYNNKNIERILNVVRNKTLYFYNLAEHTPFFSPIMRDKKDIYSIFDKRMISMLFNYYLLKVFITYIDLISNKELLATDKLKDKEFEEIVTEVQLEESETGEISEIEILRGEKKEISETIAELLISFTNMIADEKKTMNYNYEKIMEQVLRSKEKEKDDITSDLKRLTDDDREVENFFKNSKLEKWGVGLQKGLTRYVEGTYDQERENMENRLLLDIQLGKNMQVHEMNSEIYANELLENMRNEEMEDAEAMDLSHLPDDDDYGDRENYEDVDGYSYMLDDARYGYED
jgi:hypothetical protein